MRRIFFKYLAFTLFTSLFGVFATAKTYKINTQHSFINFELPYMMVSTVKGSFESFNGTFDFLPEESVVQDIKLTILAKSINTRDGKRDQHLNRSDFFNTSEYKEIIFESSGLSLAKEGRGKGQGTLTIKGISKPLTFSIKNNGLLRDPIDKNKVGLFLEITGSLNRKDYGINWNKSLDNGGVLIGDKVTFSFVVEANPIDAKPAFSRFLKNTKGSNVSSTAMVVGDSMATEQITDETQKKPLEESPKKRKYYNVFVDLLIGFFLFLLLCFVGGVVKKYLQEFLQGMMGERKSDFISDIFLYAFITIAAVYLAPFMGYKTY